MTHLFYVKPCTPPTGFQSLPHMAEPEAFFEKFCRHIKFEFGKKTREYIKQEKAAFEEEIDNISSTKWAGVEINNDLHMTIIGGKVATMIQGTFSTSNCNILLCEAD